MQTRIFSLCRAVLIGMGVAILGGCAGSLSGAQPQGAAAVNAATSRDSLAQTHWILTRWTTTTGQVREIPHDGRESVINLTFLSTGKQYQIGGFSGCNRYAGNYKFEDSKLFIEISATTRMACVAPERSTFESDYLRALSTVNTFTLDHGGAPRHLTFNLRGGDVLEFDRRQDPATP